MTHDCAFSYTPSLATCHAGGGQGAGKATGGSLLCTQGGSGLAWVVTRRKVLRRNKEQDMSWHGGHLGTSTDIKPWDKPCTRCLLP